LAAMRSIAQNNAGIRRYIGRKLTRGRSRLVQPYRGFKAGTEQLNGLALAPAPSPPMSLRTGFSGPGRSDRTGPAAH
jgi:hypothetical protein